MSDVVVLVSTCDRYEAAWHPFCYGMERYWPDCPWPVVAATNHLDFPIGYTLQFGDDRGWSATMLAALDAVDAPVVLVMHEDYWLQDAVDTAALLDFARLLLEGKAHKVFLRGGPLQADGPFMRDRRLDLLAMNSPYRTATHGIWDTDVLRALLRVGETPWQFELAGNARSFDPALTFLMVHDDIYFPHIPPPGALKQGNWTAAAWEYAEREGLTMDFHVAPGVPA